MSTVGKSITSYSSRTASSPNFAFAQGVDEKVVAEMLSRLGRSGDLRYMPAAIARLARAEGIASAVAGFGVRLADEPAERADA